MEIDSLKPQCSRAGRCQSRQFNAAPPKLSEDKISQILFQVQINFAKNKLTEDVALMFARAIERAHGIDA